MHKLNANREVINFYNSKILHRETMYRFWYLDTNWILLEQRGDSTRGNRTPRASAGNRRDRDQKETGARPDMSQNKMAVTVDIVYKKPLICEWSWTFFPLPGQHGERARSYTGCKEWKCCTHWEDSWPQGEKVRNSEVRTVQQEMRERAVALLLFHAIPFFCSFISRTVNPNYQDELGNTPLHYAALNGHRCVYVNCWIEREY